MTETVGILLTQTYFLSYPNKMRCYKSVTFIHYSVRDYSEALGLNLFMVTIIKVSALNENDTLINDKKYIVSMRLNNADRNAVRSTAARLFVRESELYRFAIYHLMHRLHKLHDESCTGSDLLPLFLEIRDELCHHLNLKKHQLFKIFNGKNTAPDKFVAMSDIELLLLPHHAIRQRLLQISDAHNTKHPNTASWLENYLREKYRIVEECEGIIK